MKVSSSRLIPVKGISPGALLVEALSSLINRISLKNFCSPRFFIDYVVNPEAGFGAARNSLFSKDGLSVLNSYRNHAKKYGEALSRLTGMKGLEQHTMMPFKGLFDSMGKGVIRQEKHWCPECYLDAIRQSTPVYDPLVFSLMEVKSCPVHQLRLVSKCPDCGATQQALPSSRRVGWCTRCGGFLGYMGGEAREVTAREQYFYDLFECRHQLLEIDVSQEFKNGVMMVVNRSGCGSVTKLTEAVCFSDRTISQWVSGRYRPTLTSFLDFCLAVNVLPSQLLVNHQDIAPQLTEARLTVRKVFNSSLEMEEIEKRLLTYALSEKITPLPAIASKLKVGVSFLSYRYPELARAVVQKNQGLRKLESDNRYHQFTDQISKIIVDLEKEGVVPSYNKVRCRMVEYHGFRYKDFTRLWGQAMKEWQAS